MNLSFNNSYIYGISGSKVQSKNVMSAILILRISIREKYLFKISTNALRVNVTAMGTATTQLDHLNAPATKVILVMDLTALVIMKSI